MTELLAEIAICVIAGCFGGMFTALIWFVAQRNK